MECSVNHSSIEAGKFCPACGLQVTSNSTAAPIFSGRPDDLDETFAAEGSFTSNERSPERLPKILGLVALGVATVLMVTGIIANKVGWDAGINQIDNIINNATSSAGSTSSSGTDSSSSGDTSWVPSGYTASPDDSTIAYQFDDSATCQSDNGNGCFTVRVTASTVCSTVAGSMDLKDSNGNVINTVTASGGQVVSGNYESLEFDDPDGSASRGQLTSLTCG
jgi:hypothetical protein